MTEILWFAVAPVEPREDAENFGGALGRKRGVQHGKFRGVEILIAHPGARIAAEQLYLQLFGNVDARVLEKRCDVIGYRTDQGILEIQQADLRQALTLRQPEKVRRMVVAQHPGWKRLERRIECFTPQCNELGACGAGQRRLGAGE